MGNPKITVLMPVYNGAQFLKEAIESILNQTFKDYELLIIDDGSSDNSRSIILSYHDERIRYVKNRKNIGLIGTLNKGINLAAGLYIARMDQDDVSKPYRLETQFRFMEKNKEVGLCGSWYEIIGSRQIIKVPVNHELIDVSLIENSCFGHPTVIIRRSVLLGDNIYYPDCSDAEDYAMWSRLSGITKLANIPEVLLEYRIHPSQISSSRKESQLNSANAVRLNHLSKLRELSAEEKSLYKDLFEKSSFTEDEILLYHGFFISLLMKNRDSKVFDTKYFQRFILNIWKRLFLSYLSSNKESIFLKFSFLFSFRLSYKLIISFDFIKTVYAFLKKKIL